MKVKDLIMKLIYCDPDAEITCLTYKSENDQAQGYQLNINNLDDRVKNIYLLLDGLDHIDFSENTIFEELGEKVLNWAKDKDLLRQENAERQFMKFMEEVFEFRDEWLLCVHEYNKCAYGEAEDDPDVVEHGRNMQLEMGDIFVTLIILCNQLSLDPVESLYMAYEKIKGRKGKTINGTFVKEEDLQ